MRRVLFHWFGRPVHSYPAMLYLGTVLGFYAQLYAAVSIGLHAARRHILYNGAIECRLYGIPLVAGRHGPHAGGDEGAR